MVKAVVVVVNITAESHLWSVGMWDQFDVDQTSYVSFTLRCDLQTWHPKLKFYQFSIHHYVNGDSGDIVLST